MRIEQNCRSTQNVLDCANLHIRNNKNRLGKELYTYEDDGADVTNHAFETAYEEAMWVGDQIAEDIAAGCRREEIAVLVRDSHALNSVEHALNQKGIRYHMPAGKKFQARAEIKNLSEYTRLFANAHLSLVSN